MTEARQPLLPEGWQILPGGLIDGLEASATDAEDEPNPVSTDEAPEAVRELGEKAIKLVKPSKPPRASDNSPDVVVVEPITLSPLNSLQKGSTEPHRSGMRVIEARVPGQGEIRAANAIHSFMKVNGGRVAEDPLINRLTSAGFAQSAARDYIEQACADGRLVKMGKFYKLTGE